MKIFQVAWLFIATTVWAASIDPPLYKCTQLSGRVTYTNVIPEEFSCLELTRLPTKEDNHRFRANIKFGDKSDRGLVLELKKPLALVQLKDGKKVWFRIDELMPVIPVEPRSTTQ